VYQGQEQHFSGGETPSNREALWLSGFDTTTELYMTAAKLNKARNTLIGLTNTTDKTYVDSQAQTLMTNDNHLCQVKGPEGFQIVSCIVNHSSSGPSYELSIGGFTAGDQVVDLISCGTSTADDTGNVTMYMNKGQPKAYVLQSLLDKMPGVCNSTKDAKDASKDASAASGLTSSLALVFTAAFASLAMLL
jgi:alpha-amylase